MAKIREPHEVSGDRQVQQLLTVARSRGIETAFDRADQSVARCPVGSAGICCRSCLEGPCRILPKGPRRGVCGAGKDTLVARSLLNTMIQGASGHAEHGREVATALLQVAEGKAPYVIRDVGKLMRVAEGLGLQTAGKSINEVGIDVAKAALEDFQKQEGALNWIKFRGHEKSREIWDKLGITPVNAHLEIAKAVTRNAMGGDADPLNLLLGSVTMGLVDGYSGLHLSSDLQDILFGTPRAVKFNYSLAVLDEKQINIAVHGHIPLLSEKIVEWAGIMEQEALNAGAEGINIVGVCCTGNELLMRQGVHAASSFSSQELVIVTGALEAMVVDIQCIMPGIQQVAECFHTEVITTMAHVKIPGASHVNFEPEHADEAAQEIVKRAVRNYAKRDPHKVVIPTGVVEAYAGFSVEQICEVTGTISPEAPLQPLIDAIKAGTIRGVAALIGCTNPREPQDIGNVTVARELLKNNVLIVTTGCAAHSLAKYGLMNEEGLEACGDNLRALLQQLGQPAGLTALPPALHMGSCVDNSRPLDLLSALADELGVPVSSLPAVGSCPETHSPKALTIGTYFIAHGVDVHIGVDPQVSGSELVTHTLTGSREDEGITMDGLFGGKLIVEKDPVQAAAILLERIDMKRAALGI